MSTKQRSDVVRRKRFHLTLHVRPDRLLLDDGEGRAEAQRPGLRVTGVPGLLVAAKRIGFFRRFAPKWTRYGLPDSVSRRVCTRTFSHPVERSEPCCLLAGRNSTTLGSHLRQQKGRLAYAEPA
jgi:hypothetical protein